jgi:hypothetical protein
MSREVTSVSALLYKSEFWIIEAKYINGIQPVEIRHFRSFEGYAKLDNIRNSGIRTRLKTT